MDGARLHCSARSCSQLSAATRQQQQRITDRGSWSTKFVNEVGAARGGVVVGSNQVHCQIRLPEPHPHPQHSPLVVVQQLRARHKGSQFPIVGETAHTGTQPIHKYDMRVGTQLDTSAQHRCQCRARQERRLLTGNNCCRRLAACAELGELGEEGCRATQKPRRLPQGGGRSSAGSHC
jgi:hypothetical protein